MGSLLTALAAAACWGTGDFLGGLTVRRLPVLTVLFVSQAVGLVFVAFVVLAVGNPMPGTPYLLWGLGAGFLSMTGLGFLYTGLARGRMGVVAPIAAMSATIPVVAGLLEGDRPSLVQLLGVLSAGIGIVLTAREPDRGEDGSRRVAAGVGWALGAAVTLGLYAVFVDRAAAADASWSALTTRVGAMALLVVALDIARPSFRMDGGRDLVTLSGLGIADNTGNLLFALATTSGLLTLVSILASLYPVTTVLLARFVLKERASRIQVVGIVFAFVGVALIAAG
jgi:drug/metabolite transporter (DMT)-like permease